MSNEKKIVWGAEALPMVEGNTCRADMVRERQGPTVSKDLRHARKPGIGTWEVSILPYGAAEEKG